MEARDRLIVALDIEDKDRALQMIETLSPVVDLFKVGIAPFTDYGHIVLEKLEEKGKKVFLDLKFHDIPNTVRNAAYAAAKKNVFMMNFHCLGGKEMLEKAREGARETGGRSLLLGVTVLTSMDREDMETIGLAGTVKDKVMELAGLAKDAGLDGVVASAEETKMIKDKFGKEFVVVTPGIRPEWAASGDQKRIVTPEAAIRGGSDYIVVGRPIIKAEDPLKAAEKIIEEMTERG